MVGTLGQAQGCILLCELSNVTPVKRRRTTAVRLEVFEISCEPGVGVGSLKLCKKT